MDIRDWPLDKIMQLPDWCFGRRWWVGENCWEPEGKNFYVIGSEELPDKFVVWGILISCECAIAALSIRLTIRLGDNVAALTADPKVYDRLLKGISSPRVVFEFFVDVNHTTWINCEREIIESSGRRLAICVAGDQVNSYEMTVGVLISALPKEVPDWLISGQGRNLL